MSPKYPIMDVHADWKTEPEQMGSKQKFWYRQPGEDKTNWLFKYPRPNTGEHWAEKIVAEIAALLSIEHAKVELAVCRDQPGTATESFARRGRHLAHGNEVLARKISGYNPDLKRRQFMYTLSNIWASLDRVYGDDEKSKKMKRRIAEYIVLDALVGNTDRHHENWGLLRRRDGDRWKSRMAPSFDHSSSLGRELLDTRRETLLVENHVGDYAENARGAIYWSEDEKHGPSPLELVRRATRSYPALFHPALVKLQRWPTSSMIAPIDRVPDRWMSPTARAFAETFVCYNAKQLRGLLP